MDWSALEGVLRCQPGYERLHVVVLILGGIASSATIIGALYALWRWWTGGRHKKAADALRDEGEHRAQLNHLNRAMELYNLSIRLNPRAGHVYYLRGDLHALLGNLNRAIADWKGCLARHPSHTKAATSLASQGITTSRHWSQRPVLLRVGGAAAVVCVVLIVGAMTPPGKAIIQMALAVVKTP